MYRLQVPDIVQPHLLGNVGYTAYVKVWNEGEENRGSKISWLSALNTYIYIYFSLKAASALNTKGIGIGISHSCSPAIMGDKNKG